MVGTGGNGHCGSSQRATRVSAQCWGQRAAGRHFRVSDAHSSHFHLISSEIRWEGTGSRRDFLSVPQGHAAAQ